ncbi:MAG: enoyl-CoA hydratase-related protein [Desulfobacterales bacterium]|nr:enoyl-CoA hydratase-related protein [Desulfobacterales bacterium]
MSPSQDDLLYAVDQGVARITINRPAQGNTITAAGISLFSQYLDQAESDPGVRLVCLSAAGDKIFCSGADLGSAMQAPAEEKQALFSAYAGLLTRLAEYPKPTLAKVNGHCLAGGTGFMLGCDVVLAREDALFGTPEVNVGLFPMMIGALIFRNVLRKRAMDMILTGEKLSAAQALDMGLVSRVLPREEFEAGCEATIQTLISKSPLGLKLGKAAFKQVEGLPLDRALEELAQGLQQVAATQDAREGITAFIEKRQPVFTGK